MMVHAIIVSFNPDWKALSSELQCVYSQVEMIWLIDNASVKSFNNEIDGLSSKEKIKFIEMPANLGLGAAQNTGIQLARTAGASHVLILDQDSQPMPDMVARLLSACEQLCSAGMPVAAVAPVYADSMTGTMSGFVRLGWLDFKKQSFSSDKDVVEADFVISSGSLIPVSALDAIGPMDESLFIDHVDTEWCLRAQAKGYKLFGVPGARMIHALGDRRARIWFLRWRNVSFHSPFRYYYILRNSLLMQRRSYIPFKWRVAEALRCLRVLFFYGLFSPQRSECLRMMFKGIWHGIRGVSGPLKS